MCLRVSSSCQSALHILFNGQIFQTLNIYFPRMTQSQITLKHLAPPKVSVCGLLKTCLAPAVLKTVGSTPTHSGPNDWPISCLSNHKADFS